MTDALLNGRRYVVVFAPSFEAAREFARKEQLRFGWWIFAHRADRLPKRDPQYCETVLLDGYHLNPDVFAAKQAWERRRKPKA